MSRTTQDMLVLAVTVPLARWGATWTLGMPSAGYSGPIGSVGSCTSRKDRDPGLARPNAATAAGSTTNPRLAFTKTASGFIFANAAALTSFSFCGR